MSLDTFPSRPFKTLTDLREEAEDVPSNRSGNPTMGDVINARMSRRGMLTGSLAVSAIAATISPMAFLAGGRAHAQGAGSAFGFTEIAAGVDETHHVAEGYDAKVLLRWGDPVTAGAPDFDPLNHTAEAQARQFGYNNDYIGFVPLDGDETRGLLLVNHEYTDAHLMFPGIASVVDGKVVLAPHTKEMVDIEMAAHGGSVVEIVRDGDSWAVVKDSPLNRRITASTPMVLTGPAAGHDRLKTSEDPTGMQVLGTINNCAGGVTPWGTYLMAEENFHGYFGGEMTEDHPEFVNYERYGAPGGDYSWANFYDRFDIVKEPNAANRYGWIVEVDPSDPTSMPKKRTAMGRFKHEGCETVVNGDGRVVLYSGDDQRFDYVYKFVTASTFNAQDRAANADLLDEGTLHVARFDADGTVEWMPLVHGEGPLTAENGFNSQADVMIETRRAADLLGATPMDRPEDVQPNAKTGKVYVMLTNNTDREPGDENAANPRADNAFGHIIEIAETDGDFASLKSTWEILVKCGDPAIAEVGATFSAATTENGWFGMPDNCAIDADGRLWVSTDGNSLDKTGRADGLWAVDTEGPARGTSQLFFRVPVGAEMCGPYFTGSGETLFLAVQHPGDEGLATYEAPATRWPDFSDTLPVRPSVVVIRKQDGGRIG